ncbi:MAG: ribonuclease P protein component [Clostridiales bacterium]|nr:ribonuclease P protein component [Clostridiales bacterium]
MLAKVNRLNKHGSFAYVYRNGKRVASSDLVLIFTPAKSVRVGFSVSNKVGKAVVRNKVRRRLRAITQLALPKLAGCQAIVAANPSAAGKDYSSLDEQLNGLFSRAGLIA